MSFLYLVSRGGEDGFYYSSSQKRRFSIKQIEIISTNNNNGKAIVLLPGSVKRTVDLYTDERLNELEALRSQQERKFKEAKSDLDDFERKYRNVFKQRNGYNWAKRAMGVRECIHCGDVARYAEKDNSGNVYCSKECSIKHYSS